MDLKDKALYHQSSKLCKEMYINEMSGIKLPFLKGGKGKSARDRTKPDPIASPFRAFVKENQPIFLNDNPDLDYYNIKRLL